MATLRAGRGKGAVSLMEPSLPARIEGDDLIAVVVAVAPALWRELLSAFLSGEGHFRVVGRAANEEELRVLLEQSGATVVVLDYEAFGPNCEGLVARLRRAAPRARFLILARRSEPEVVKAVLRAGASGLVRKESTFATLLYALRAVAAGQVWANREVTAQVLAQLVSPRGLQAEEARRLTRREWEVLDALGQGLSNKEIARLLGMSEKTVKSHLNNISAKLGLRGRFALALWAPGQIKPES